jgi:DNA-binding XRE family transcriptional regulator
VTDWLSIAAIGATVILLLGAGCFMVVAFACMAVSLWRHFEDWAGEDAKPYACLAGLVAMQIAVAVVTIASGFVAGVGGRDSRRGSRRHSAGQGRSVQALEGMARRAQGVGAQARAGGATARARAAEARRVEAVMQHARSTNGRPRGSRDLVGAARPAPTRKECRVRATFIGPAIQEAREAAGISAEELASRIGLTTWMVSAYEAGRRIPPLDRVIAIACALGCRVIEPGPGA